MSQRKGFIQAQQISKRDVTVPIKANVATLCVIVERLANNQYGLQQKLNVIEKYIKEQQDRKLRRWDRLCAFGRNLMYPVIVGVIMLIIGYILGQM